MPARFTNYGAHALLNNMRGAQPQTLWAGLYLGLFTASPTDTGSLANEVSGSGYSRISVEFGAASAREIVSINLEDFPEALAPWGVVTHVAICDAASAGNMIAYGPYQDGAGTETSRLIAAGDVIRYSPGRIKLGFV